jgi:hypothetical protein
MCLGEAPMNAPAEQDAVPAAAGQTLAITAPGRQHLVVVRTRALAPGDSILDGAVLRTQFWHPRDRSWIENDFQTLEHARRLFIDESGWVLRQEQPLDDPLAHELVFEAHRIDFARPSQAEMLRDIGLVPEGGDEGPGERTVS